MRGGRGRFFRGDARLRTAGIPPKIARGNNPMADQPKPSPKPVPPPRPGALPVPGVAKAAPPPVPRPPAMKSQAPGGADPQYMEGEPLPGDVIHLRFLQQPWVQSILPFVTSFALHAGII